MTSEAVILKRALLRYLMETYGYLEAEEEMVRRLQQEWDHAKQVEES